MATTSEEPQQSQPSKSKVTHVLGVEEELRFEAEEDEWVHLEVIEGQAEIFGTEITCSNKYKFQPGSKVAVYTWHGCKVALSGKFDVQYMSSETPMRVYLNTHAALEQMRQRAEEDKTRGPRVMIVGPTDVGKTTLCKLLMNYATRLGRSPMLVDLDVGQSEVSIPGTVGALVVERPADVEEGYALTSPLVFHFGHKTPSENLQLYNMLISRLAEVINMRCNTIDNANISGVIINTCGWIKGGGYQSIVHTAGSFEVDIIMVLDQERLYTELTRDMPDFVKVIHLPKSGGVVERSQKTRISLRDAKIREYFYGIDNNMYPHTFEVDFADVHFYKIGAPALPDSMLPLGMPLQDNSTKLVPLKPGPTLIHRVVSLSSANSVEEDIVRTNVAGFLVITEVNMEKEKFTVLSPSPRPLPKHILLVMDDVQFMEIR